MKSRKAIKTVSSDAYMRQWTGSLFVLVMAYNITWLQAITQTKDKVMLIAFWEKNLNPKIAIAQNVSENVASKMMTTVKCR